MTPRQLPILAMIVATLLIASLAAVIARRSSLPAPTPEPDRLVKATNPFVERPNMVDRLDFFDTPAMFDRATLQHVSLATTQPAHIVLADQRPRSFPRSGTWVSDVIETACPFTELIPSWNASTPPQTGVMFHVKTRDAKTAEWSPWLYMGQWGRAPITDPADHIARFEHGIVNVDNLTLDRDADAYQFRATLLSFAIDRNVNPSIRRITVSYSGQVDDPETRQKLARDDNGELATLGLSPPTGAPSLRTGSATSVALSPASNASPETWARSLPVPFRAQGIEAKPLAGQVCSPTSTSMVMTYMGVDRTTEENALAIYDEEHDMFGNWARATQRAGELGLDAWLQRFRNWDQVKAMIARGQPIVAGIKFSKGEFPSALYGSTNGHLIVIRGFTKAGDVIVNDPASKSKGDGAVYKAAELGKAWFGHGGVGYVIRKPEQTNPSPATAPSR